MRRRGKTRWFIAIVTVGVLMLSACSAGDGDMADVRSNIQASASTGVSFNGEWTVGKQVVDTARLVMTEALTVRLPETYLVGLCFNSAAKEYGTDKASVPTAIEPMGVPTRIEIRNQGYTDEAVFSDFTTAAEKYDGVMLYRSAYFVVNIDGVDYLVELLSTENGNAVYRADTMGWTIAIPVDRFRITNVETMEERIQQLDEPFTLYYNTTERIFDNSRGDRTSAA